MHVQPASSADMQSRICEMTPPSIRSRDHLQLHLPGAMQLHHPSKELRAVVPGEVMSPHRRGLDLSPLSGSPREFCNLGGTGEEFSRQNTSGAESTSSSDVSVDGSLREYSNPEEYQHHYHQHQHEHDYAPKFQFAPKDDIHQSIYFNEAKKRAQIPFLDHKILECDCNGLKYTKYDITLSIPEGAVPDNKKIHFEVGMAILLWFIRLSREYPTNLSHSVALHSGRGYRTKKAISDHSSTLFNWFEPEYTTVSSSWLCQGEPQ